MTIMFTHSKLERALLILFATAERVPFLQKNTFRRLGLTVGGLLSGFFGGLTGHQGAFRSAFLVQGMLSEKAFVATNAAIAVMVDATRLVIYGFTFHLALIRAQSSLIMIATLSSFLGVYLATLFLEKVTMRVIRDLITVMMYALGVLLCIGMI